MANPIVLPSFTGQEPTSADMRQLVSALELRFQSLELENQSLFDTDPLSGASSGEFAPLVHTHIESDITDLGAYLTGITGESIFDLSDVSGSPSTNDVLVWTGAQFSPQTQAAASLALNDLTNVNVLSPANGEVLTFDSGGNAWIASASAGGNTLAGLTDVEVTSQTQYDLLYNVDGSNWTDTDGELKWNATLGALQLSFAKSINWLDVLGTTSIEMAVFDNTPAVLQTWPQLDTFTQQDTAEWTQQSSSNFRFVNDGTFAYRGSYDTVAGRFGILSGSTYSTPYLVTDSTAPVPVNILTTAITANDIAFNGDGTKLFIARHTGGLVEERTNIGTAFQPGLGDVDTVAYTYTSTNFTTIIQSINFSADGTVMYLTGRSATVGCVQATLSTPWDMSTAGAESTIDFTDMGANASYGLRIAPDGIKFYVSDTVQLWEYDCGTAWDITGSAVYQSRTLTVTTEVPGNIFGFDVSPDGTTLIAAGAWGNTAANNDTNRFTSAGTGIGSPAGDGLVLGDPSYGTTIDSLSTKIKAGADTVADTIAPASGGLRVNNQLTGTGLERVLTASDDVHPHTGEVTGDGPLTLDVTSITNRTDVVADSADDVPIHDDTDGTLKKVNLSSITDGGYF